MNQAPTTVPLSAPSRFWVRDTRGRPSASLTFALIAFVVVTLAYVCGIVASLGSVQLRQFDPAAASAYLVPILGLYFGRRLTEARRGRVEEDPG